MVGPFVISGSLTMRRRLAGQVEHGLYQALAHKDRAGCNLRDQGRNAGDQTSAFSLQQNAQRPDRFDLVDFGNLAPPLSSISK